MDEARKALPTPRASINRHCRCVMNGLNSTQAVPRSESKTCTKCLAVKSPTEFHIGKEYPDGRKATCKVCMQAQRRAKYQSQRELEVEKRRMRKTNPEWQALLPQRRREAEERLAKRIEEAGLRDRCCSRCASILPATAEYFSRSNCGSLGLASWCKDCARIWHAKTAAQNPEKLRENARDYYDRNSIAILERSRMRRREDPAYALRMRVSCGVRQSLRRTRLDTSWIALLGYSALELKDHLQSLFTEGMNWERFLQGEIEIDHVIPVSFFNPSSPDSLEFLMCWNLKNLQPLWRADNRRKSDTLPANFRDLWNELYYEAVN